MKSEVQKYVESCNTGCDATNPKNPTSPLGKVPTPEEPWKICAMDLKRPIGGPQGVYVHTIMDLYSRYPISTVVKITAFKNVEPMMNKVMYDHGVQTTSGVTEDYHTSARSGRDGSETG